MDKDFCENWRSLRKITETFHVVKSHDSHSNQICGENKRVKKKILVTQKIMQLLFLLMAEIEILKLKVPWVF